jgi:hypothetical protein
LLTVVCSGNGTGAILFHTFLQELINSLAGETGGTATRVSVPNLDCKSIRTDADGRTLLVEETDTGSKETVLFRMSKGGEPLLGTIQ